MKIETAVLLIKGACMTTMPTVAALGAGLSELNGPTIWGVPTKVLMLACSIYGVFAGAVLAWLSSSASDLIKRGNGGAVPPEPPKP
jgi:hypothetical protein